MKRLIGKAAVAMLSGLALVACGDDSGGDDGNQLVISMTSSSSGDGQTATPGATLPQPLRVIVTQGGVGVADVTVTWTTTDGGTLTPTTSVTDATGATQATWRLGPTGGGQQANATINSSSTGSVTFSAIAGNATIVVDNNLFSPSTVILPTGGGSVTWVWDTDAQGHNVKPSSTNPSAIPSSVGGDSNLLNAPFQFSVDFTTTGVYRFYCFSHGAQDGSGNVSGMSGTITVP